MQVTWYSSRCPTDMSSACEKEIKSHPCLFFCQNHHACVPSSSRPRQPHLAACRAGIRAAKKGKLDLRVKEPGKMVKATILPRVAL